jgi:hypothetical protein
MIALPRAEAFAPSAATPAEPCAEGEGRTRLLSVVLPYAVSIRDFVHSGTFAELLAIPDVRMEIFTQNPDLPEFDALRSPRVVLREMGEAPQGRLERLLRQYYPILFSDQFEFIRQNVERSALRRWTARAVVAVRRMLGTRATLGLYARWLRLVSNRPAQNLFPGRPDLVIGTRSLVNSLDYPFILEAASRGLPILTIASSWDNFTTKGFFPFPVEQTIVWNRKMADELVQIFDVPADRIVVAGYPRVALIRNTGPFTDAQGYLRSIGLGAYRRFVLHTVSYAELTRPAAGEPPLEYRMVRELAEALLPTLPEDTCILARLHPYSDTKDEAVFGGLEGLRVFVPGRQDRYVERVMSAADEVHLACQLQFSACIVSMASTITIDALALRRPIVNVMYDPAERPASMEPMIPRFYEYNHFRDLVALVEPPLARTPGEVIDFVHRCLAADQPPQADLDAFERFYVPAGSADYARTVRETVESLLDRLAPVAAAGGRS